MRHTALNYSRSRPQSGFPKTGSGLVAAVGDEPWVSRLVLLGVDIHRNGHGLLEQVTVAAESLPKILSRLRQKEEIEEILILSTCNRTEIYMLPSPDCSHLRVVEILQDANPAWAHFDGSHVTLRQGWQVVEHLFAVTSGLEAMVFGETEITAQVKQAHRLARETEAIGPRLDELVQKAMRTRRKIHHGTDIGSGGISMGSAAAELAVRHAEANLDADTILVMGAGMMAEKALRSLQRAGARNIWIVNRTTTNASTLARRYGAHVAAWDDRFDWIARSASVIVALPPTASRIVPGDVLPHVKPDGQLLFVDLSIPRAVDPDLAKDPRITIAGLPAIRKQLESHIERRKKDEPQARQIVAAEVARYRGRILQNVLMPMMLAVREETETVIAKHAAGWDLPEPVAAGLQPKIKQLAREVCESMMVQLETAMRNGHCPKVESYTDGPA